MKCGMLIIFFLCGIHQLSAQSYTISGYISDAASGETLISATVIDTISGKGNVTNNYGHYSLTLPKGSIALSFSYIGYSSRVISFDLRKDTVMNIRLDLSNLLDEVTVVGHRTELGVKGSQMSAVEVPIAQIKNIPTLFGENDLIKALQLLPGVQSGTEGSAGLYVRGGGPDENLLLLDGVPVYNVNHMFGFFSVFNSNALKNVTLYKGSYPARFGGRLSSVVDIRMKDGDEKNFHGNASIGLISSKIQVEGPIAKERTTFNISARRTYIDLLAQPFLKMYQEGDTKFSGGYYFYDVNAKFTHKISDKHKLFLSTYFGDDAMHAKVRTEQTLSALSENRDWMKMRWDWGNMIGAFRWNYLVTNKLFVNTTLSYTRYQSNLGLGMENEFIDKTVTPQKKNTTESVLNYNSGIHDWTAKVDFDFTPNPAHEIKFGTNYTYHTFSPDVSSIKYSDSKDVSQKIDTVLGSPKVYAHETMSYFEDNISLNRMFKVNLGVHFSSFSVQKKHFVSIQPRVGLRVLLNDNLSVKAGYAPMSQYIHMLSNNTISLPTDLWVPVTKKIKPMRSDQYSAGAFYSLKNIGDISLEGYYKTMDNLLEYKDGASFMGQSTGWEEKVSMGRGIAYGVELLLQRSFGNTTGWVGYTWSKTDRIFDKPDNIINNGNPFPAKYDRRHDVSLTLAHKFSDRFDIAASWIYSTGNTATFGYQDYKGMPSPNYRNPYDAVQSLTYIGSRNNFRYNSYHRLDLGVNFHKKMKRGWTRTWNISVYNAYNQLNPFIVYVNSESSVNPQTGQSTSRNKLIQGSLFPIIPSVSYSIKF